jgi:hypothetical protein
VAAVVTSGFHPKFTRHGTGELDKGDRPVGLPPSRFMGAALISYFARWRFC